ncbi:LINE-1 retrotransposable element ORF2 protein [Vitis vinifera]|uniref:LINE-1 retrotransposable element ORF2 protein n=1 Tax=Vitis vinifera TaxID=29760 RepID=A0A438GQW5_VITVI|nr:LINE-1 retrotransposable element ORF2 protein [Vitis vinifera]
MQESPVCKRLDRFLYSNEWELSFPQSLQEVLPRWTSDHWPIVLDTNPFKWGPTPFKFENMWLQHHNFKESFSSWWREFEGNGWEGHKFMRKLQFVKAKLKVWNKNTFGMLKERKKTTLDEIAYIDAIEQEGALSSDLAAQRVIRKGDSESITEEILLYFKKLYSSPPGESWRVEDRDKAPGPDDFTIAVFQDCWDVIKEDLVRVFAEFHNSGIINQNTNASFIVLLPKKSQSKKISDFRPISLITCLYKIIAKVLSGRLRGVLQETIHSTQGEEGVVFKIDFEKAYDHVKWDFLDHVLEKKGFSSKWRSWMRGCLSSVSYAILVNGNAKGWVKAARSLRQGDPLSPFLFTIVADVLSRMLLKAEERNLLEGFRVSRNRCRVTHLQFADDTILFANPREEELQTLKSLLLVFGQISGLKVNLDKSNLFGINLDQNHLSRLALLLDCKASDWPILYLGLPLGGNPTACGFWDPVIERISRRLDGWQKLTYLSVLHGCKNREDTKGLSMVRGWEGKRDHLVRWEAVCKPRVIGGLGIGKIPLRNRALLGKWLWSSLGRSNGHTAVLGSHSTRLSGFFQVYSVYRRRWGKNSLLGRFVVGDQTFKDQYPRLFRVVMDKNIPISSILGSSRPFSWNFNFRRNLTDSEIEDLERLMHSLDCMNLSTSVSDVRSWSLCSSVPFKVKPLSGLWHIRRRISRLSLPPLFSDVGVVAQTFSASQDGLGSSEKHFGHDVHQLQRIWQVQERGNSMAKREYSVNLGCVAGKKR